MPFTVFELVNARLKEIFVGVSSRPPSELARALQDAPPASVALWTPEERLPPREVETFRLRHDAERFCEGYIAALSRAPAGWKVLCETRF